MVDLYWKCYAYGDELKPHIEFLDGIMLSSTRDIAPSCVENVDELIERQEKSLTQLETKRGVVKDLIEKGKKILENPDKPKFLEGNVKKIQEGWEETKDKAAAQRGGHDYGVFVSKITEEELGKHMLAEPRRKKAK